MLMILAMHLPIIGFILLSHFHPGSVFYIYYATVIGTSFSLVLLVFMMYLIMWPMENQNVSLLYRNRIYVVLE
jgi:hypothetical protein